MAAAIKFLDFNEQMGLGNHNLSTDTLNLCFTNVLPLNTQTNIDLVTAHAPPAAANGYTAGGYDVQNTWGGTLDGSGFTMSASGGDIGPYRYGILYNTVNGLLIFYYDIGSAITLTDGKSFDVTIPTNIFTLI